MPPGWRTQVSFLEERSLKWGSKERGGFGHRETWAGVETFGGEVRKIRA